MTDFHEDYLEGQIKEQKRELEKAKQIIKEYIEILKGNTKTWQETQAKAEAFIGVDMTEEKYGRIVLTDRTGKKNYYGVSSSNTMKNKETEQITTQDKIADVLDGMKDLLLYKNEKYGDSAINPKKVFYKGDSTNSILIRLDDKIGRVMSNPEETPRINDTVDIIGYCTLLLISMGVTSHDLAQFKD